MSIADRIQQVTRAKPKPVAKKAAADERRFAQRRGGLIPAMISVHPLKPVTVCMVADMSSTGARLELDESWGGDAFSGDEIPDDFVLIYKRDRVEVDCMVVWRKAHSLGIRFSSAMRPSTRKVVMRGGTPEPRKATAR